ncbi:hypothetical protein CDL12_30346 [Handroanthus impetiginosus]|uniref:Uncharacterized protein n=1 Tax=Handroanthus impetiginosus TaxID=429701 RepID=A0A2G9FVT6_9LAMI|nr:hypothetical protein CDL12_30346 [Handroanthus impetiginosus]
MAYCEKIGEIIDFFQWIEEAYNELKKDFPNFNNASFLAVLESTYQMYTTAKGKPIQTIHSPSASLVIKTEERVVDDVPYKFNINNDSINNVINQNNYSNMCMQSISKQTTRIEEFVSKVGSGILKKEESSSKKDYVPLKPPPSFEKDKFHLNSKMDSEFVEELIVGLQKIKVEEEKSKITITTLRGENIEEEIHNEKEKG